MIRARAGIGFTLTEAMDDGHCGLPLDDLVPVAERLLEIPASIVEQALTFELEAGEVWRTRSGNAAASSWWGCIGQNEP